MRVAWVVLLGACSYAPPRGDVGGQTDAAIEIDAPPAADDGIFKADGSTLALFELDGDVTDSSGNDRNATLIGGEFVATAWGQGLSVPASDDQGFQWSAFANLIVHPYTIEMVVTPRDTGCWSKLFGPSDTVDTGWNYCDRFQTFPDNFVGPVLEADERHYFAIVSTSASTLNLFVNGTLVGAIDASFNAPPAEAIFFRDDTQTSRDEALDGVIDAVRISSKARTADEIAAVQTRLLTRP
jgi:hypothetical protein